MIALLALVAALVPQVVVGPGMYRPVDAKDPEADAVAVAPFRLDVTAVTNAQYESFVRAHPEWQRGQVPALLADERYLVHWEAAAAAGDHLLADAPVTDVSWFAAAAYCETRGARLPTTAEWEVAAAADETRKDASADETFRKRILDWYSRPAEPPRRVGMGPANAWGVRDLHGVIWEWVEDFQSALAPPDSRNDRAGDRSRVCGEGGLAGGEKRDYAAFMRLAMRSALTGRSTMSSLGFRCASDVEAGP